MSYFGGSDAFWEMLGNVDSAVGVVALGTDGEAGLHPRSGP